MPLTYRPRPLSAHVDRAGQQNDDLASDPDDTIVLSDLVRRGEASRLRRRGAMRIDHNMNVPQRNSTPPVIYVGPSAWDTSINQPSTPSLLPSRPSRASRSLRRTGEEDQNEYSFTLVCGGLESDGPAWTLQNYDSSSYDRPVLPVYATTSSSTVIGHRRRQSNGCGTLVHLHAAPRSKHHAWTARSEASSAVVSLDGSYFEQPVAEKLVKNNCGCVREGIGCAICGKPLGTRYKPCKTAGDSVNPRFKPSTPMSPEDPQYWQPSSHRSTCQPSDNDFFVYTFFASAVTSFPAYEFSRKPQLQETDAEDGTRGHAARSDLRNDRQDVYLNVYDDRYLTASPASLSDSEEDQEPRRASSTNIRRPSSYSAPPISDEYQTQPFDPDGEFALDEPGSPDKTPEATLVQSADVFNSSFSSR